MWPYIDFYTTNFKDIKMGSADIIIKTHYCEKRNNHVSRNSFSQACLYIHQSCLQHRPRGFRLGAILHPQVDSLQFDFAEILWVVGLNLQHTAVRLTQLQCQVGEFGRSEVTNHFQHAPQVKVWQICKEL